MVRYTVKAEPAAENVELVRAVYDELHGAQAAAGFDVPARGRGPVRPPRRDRGGALPPPRRTGLPALPGGIPESCEEDFLRRHLLDRSRAAAIRGFNRTGTQRSVE